MIVRFVHISGIVAHHRFKVIVRFVNISGIVDHQCLEGIVRFVNISGNIDHHCLKVIVRFVDIGVMVNNSHQYQQSEQSSLNSDGQQFTSISTKRTIISKQ